MAIPVTIVCDTGQGVIPRQECGEHTKGTAGPDERWIWFALGVTVEIPDAEHQEGEVQGEEEKEEGDGRT